MNLQSRKLQVLQDVMLVDDEQTLHGIEELLHSRRVGAYERTLVPMTEDELRERVRQSEKDFEQGRVVEAQDLLNRFK
jgi:hypothetical protein